MAKIQTGKVRGTRLLMGEDAREQREAEAAFRSRLH